MGRTVISCCRTCVLSFHENNEQTEQVARVKMEKSCLLAASWEVTSPHCLALRALGALRT